MRILVTGLILAALALSGEAARVREQAPAFTTEALMPDGTFKDISLSDYAGKWVVLFFYPLDFTFI